MKRVYADQLSQVKAFMDKGNKRQLLRQFQEAVKETLKDLKNDPDLSFSIFSVQSREDSDPYNPIKSDKKIAIKLHKWRQKNRDNAQLP